MARKTGYVKHEFKSSSSVPTKKIPPSPSTNKVWYLLDSFKASELALGVTHFDPELAGQLPSVKPKGIETQWVKGGGVGPSPQSKGHDHAVGGDRAWKSTGGGGIEDIQVQDLPFELWIWHDGGSDLEITKAVDKAHNPLAEVIYTLGGSPE